MVFRHVIGTEITYAAAVIVNNRRGQLVLLDGNSSVVKACEPPQSGDTRRDVLEPLRNRP